MIDTNASDRKEKQSNFRHGLPSFSSNFLYATVSWLSGRNSQSTLELSAPLINTYLYVINFSLLGTPTNVCEILKETLVVKRNFYTFFITTKTHYIRASRAYQNVPT